MNGAALLIVCAAAVRGAGPDPRLGAVSTRVGGVVAICLREDQA